MIANPMFNGFVSEDVIQTLRTVGNAFTEAERQDRVSPRLGREYYKALRAYESALADCPWSPGSSTIDMSPDDAMRKAMNEELATVHNEVARIRAHFDGVLPLTSDDDEES